MMGFCGAFDIVQRSVSFSQLKRMCGMHKEGSAYISREIGILCDSPIQKTEDGQLLLTRSYNGYLYTAAVASRGHVGARSVLELYFAEGDEFVHRLDFPYTMCLYDSRCGELTLLRSSQSKEPLFFAKRDSTLFFASSLRPLIRLYGGCVRVSCRVLMSYLREPSEGFPEGLFCDIVNIPEGHMLLASSFGESLVPFAERQAKGTVIPQNARQELTSMRKIFTEQIFLHCYPHCDKAWLDDLTRREKKRVERQLDAIVGEYLELGRGVLAREEMRALLSEVEEEKSTPLRLLKKGVLCKTAIWFDSFNLVLT